MTDDWDALAATFDDAADHGLRDPAVRAAWWAVLEQALPPAPAVVADLACGTGSLSLLLAERGYAVTGVDLSAAMLDRARDKAGDVATFLAGDAAAPPLPPGSVDVVLARHVLFLLPDPRAVLERWLALLRPGGRLVLVEGFWSTGSGLHANEVVRLLPGPAEVLRLEDRPALWGGPVTDERYLVLARSA